MFKEIRRKDRKLEIVEAIEVLNKYSPDYIEKGKIYIANAGSITKVIRINVEHISGKARR
ncbi:hypothetical protein [Clostridium muellerianum]|uniref:hypothetical protein n=1 Tax=Clostridium muellerianum TaxID=2716538 RepID=UPI00197D89FE|nr:hypothetical protein [Clostridium muellerianum]